MQRKRFRYYFKADDTTYYYVVGKEVFTTTTKTPLKSDPMDWKDADIQFVRDVETHGVYRTLVDPVTFVREGATILRHVRYNLGREGVCFLYVEELNHTTQLYEFFYQARVNLRRKVDSFHDFQCDLLDDGLANLIRSKHDTLYEVPILNSNSVKVFNDGTAILSNQIYTVTGDPAMTSIDVPNVIGAYTSVALLEGYSAGTTENRLAPSVGLTTDLNNDYLFEATADQTATISISNLNFFFSVTGGTVVLALIPQIWIVYGQHGSEQHYLLYSGPTLAGTGQSMGGSPPVFINVSAQITLSGPHVVTSIPGDRVALNIVWNTPSLVNTYPTGQGPDAHFQYAVLDDKGTISIQSKFRHVPVTYRGYRYKDYVSQFLAIAGNGQYSFASDYLSNPSLSDLDSNPYNVIVSSGDAMRQLGDGSSAATAAKIVGTIGNIIKDCISRDMVGFGVEGNTLRLEKLTYFYDKNTMIVDLGEVVNFENLEATNYQFNSFNIGYEPQNNDDIGGSLNGKYDFHNTLYYSCIGLDEPLGYDAVSPYIASMYAVNFICFNLAGKTTTDTKNDNSTYLTAISNSTNGFGEYLLSRKQNDPGNSVTGLPGIEETAFNIELSPGHNRKRLEPLLNVLTPAGATLSYQTTDKNDAVQSNLGSGLIVEKQDIPNAALASPLFLPMIFQFDTEVPINIPDLIAANPYGYIQFSWQGNIYKGFIDEVGIKPSDNSVYTWKLLAHPDTDLGKLVR